jgi:trans-2,3-dihydro-3-hydroxyanthranilate isomerase
LRRHCPPARAAPAGEPKVRIFIPTQEIAFGGHPTLGTAMVLRDRPGTRSSASKIVLDLQVGKIPVDFSWG